MKLPDFRLERYFASHEFTARYPLCSSDCESLTVETLLGTATQGRKGLDSLWLGYTESTGHPELRSEIAKLYQNILPEEILVHSGAEEAIFNLMNTQLFPGDHIIVHWPCYQSLFQIADSIGCEVTRWKSSPENEWQLDPEFLFSKLKSNTKLVVINSPHNPTGSLMAKDVLTRIAHHLHERGTILFMDEVYRGLEYKEEDRLPAACDLSPTAVSLGVMSKAFGLAGLRIGWIATKDRPLLKLLASFKDYTTICSSAPSEFLATLALKNKDQVLNRNRGIIKKNLSLLDRFLDRHSHLFSWVRPKAGCIAFPRLIEERPAEPFTEELLRNTGVLLAPGTQFFFPGPHFRIGFGRSSFEEGLGVMASYLKSTGLATLAACLIFQFGSLAAASRRRYCEKPLGAFVVRSEAQGINAHRFFSARRTIMSTMGGALIKSSFNSG